MYMDAWSWFLYTVLFFCGVIFCLMFIHPLMSIVLIILWLYGIIGYIISGKNIKCKMNNKSYFTDEDFIYCKMGEWVSKR